MGSILTASPEVVRTRSHRAHSHSSEGKRRSGSLDMCSNLEPMFSTHLGRRLLVECAQD